MKLLTPKQQLLAAKRKAAEDIRMKFIEKVKLLLNLEVIPEYRFNPKRKWRLDYAIPSIKVAIEVEGAVWANGRHTRGSGFIKDMEKYNALSVSGWTLIRVTPSTLFDQKTIENVQNCTKNDTFLNENA